MTELWRQGASLYQGRRAVGGHIELSQGVLEFKPHVVDRKTGGHALSVTLRSITSIEKTGRSWNPATFSPRKCLLVRTSDGVAAKFLVNKLDSLVTRLEVAVRDARAG